MNYDQRISFLKEWFKSDIITRFNMPRDLDPKVVAMDIIETVNRNIHSSADQQRMSHLVASITKEVAQSAKTRTLPTAKEFVDACSIASKAYREPAVGTSKPDDDLLTITAKRVRAGEAISEFYLRGTMRLELQGKHGITDEQLKPYEIFLEKAAYKQ